MSLPRISIGRPVAVAMLFVAVAILGGLSFTRLPVDLLPDVAYPRLVVYTSYPGVAPREVERFVTERIEQALSAVPGKESLESVTREGMSLVTVRFAWGTDMDFASLNVREKLDGIRASLPAGVEGRPIMLRTDPRSDPILSISASGEEMDLWALKDLSETVFRRRLEQIDGVAQASVTGGLEREIQVTVDPVRLAGYGLTVQDVAARVAAANAPSASAIVRHGNFDFSLRTLGELVAVPEIEDVVVAIRPTSSQNVPGNAPRPDGRVLLRDVATVVDGFRERETIARYNGSESVGILVFKEPRANTVRVTETVNQALDELRAQYPAVELDVAASQAEFVAGAINNLKQQMLLGALMAFVVLIFFLRDARYSMAIALAIPISVIGTFALLHLAGVSLNIMSMGGLALGIGMLVDNSIVVIENIFRHREKGTRAALAAAVGTEEVQRAITASTLTTIAVFGPIIYVRGVAGELFAALSFAVAFSLLASLLVAVTLLPTMAARWDDAERRAPGRLRRAWAPVAHTLAAPLRGFDRVWAGFTGWYHRTLLWCLEHRAVALAAAAGLLLLTVPLALDLNRSMLPEVEQGEFRVRIDLPRGTPLERTAAFTAEVEEALLGDSAVAAVFSRIGKQLAAAGFEERESGLHTALLEVRLHEDQVTPPVLARLRARFADLPPGTLAMETGQATAMGRLLGAGEADLAVRIRAEDLEGAMAYGEQLARVLAADQRLTNVRLGTDLGQPEFEVELDRERAAMYNINPRDVVETVEDYMYGELATDFVAFDAKIPVWVRLPQEDRRRIETLNNLRVRGIPLSELLIVHESTGPVEVQRVDQNRVVPVFADVSSGGVDEAVAAVEASLAAAPPADRDMRVTVGGENEEMRHSFRELALAFALAVLLVYMILAAQFESFLHPFTVLLSVPMGLIGAVVALWLMNSGLNVVSIIGLVILVGIVNNDAVVKVDFINQMREAGMNTRDAVVEAGRARVRPIVMNTITTMVAVLPMMLGIGAGANLQAPMAVAIFGGLVTSTLLTLLILPLFYEIFDDAGVWLRNRFRGGESEPAVVATPRAGATQFLEPMVGGD
ncbi:MAG: efflux RND transporter permease subunit [Gemmatimonadota bacterium]